MKRVLQIVPIVAIAILLSGCTAMMNSSAYGTGDLYRTDNRAEVAARLKAEAEAERLAAEARQAQWEARLAQANAAAAEAEYYAAVDEEPNFTNIVADNYESAYARRLYGFSSPTYRMPSSYYDMLTSSSIYYATAYDPAYYNIMVSGDQVWVEPKYITSMFGTWGATNVTFGIYSSPWNYGWRWRVDPFYYSMWGYPHYSWYDWNWNMCYNPYYYDWCWHGYYDPFYPHHHHHYPGYHPMPAPPTHRPDNRPGGGHITGTGASSGPGNLNGSRVNSGSRYTSPTTNRSYGTTSGRVDGRPTSGSTSKGYNSNSVRPTSGTTAGSRLNGIESNTRITNGVSTSNGTNSNFRQGGSNGSSSRTTTTTVTNTNRGGGSNNRVGTQQSGGNYRQGSTSHNGSSSGARVGSSSSSSRSSSSSSNFRSSGSSSSSSYRGGSTGSSSSGSFRSGSSSGSSRR